MEIDDRDLANIERLLEMIHSVLTKMNERLQQIERAIYESQNRE